MNHSSITLSFKVSCIKSNCYVDFLEDFFPNTVFFTIEEGTKEFLKSKNRKNRYTHLHIIYYIYIIYITSICNKYIYIYIFKNIYIYYIYHIYIIYTYIYIYIYNYNRLKYFNSKDKRWVFFWLSYIICEKTKWKLANWLP